MNRAIVTIAITCLITGGSVNSALANTAVVSGIINQLADGSGTTFDTWKINMLNPGAFKVNVLAFESTSNDVIDASDINGDGEFTYLDPDTYFYNDTGNPLVAADLLARCDDIANNCDTINTSTIKLSSLTEAEGATDGSIHFRRDPAFDVELVSGSFLYLIGDYRVSTSDAEAGLNVGDSIRNTLDGGHADYQLTFSSDTMNFDVSGNTITVSSVPVPAALWLFGTGFIGLFARRKQVVV